MKAWLGIAVCTRVAVVQTQVVKRADEAANAYQIFIRPGEAVGLAKEDETEGAGTVTLCSLS